MNVVGIKLERVSPMIPAGGILGALLPLFALAGLIACIGDFGAPGLEKAIVAVGMFAAGALMSRSLPIWREAREGELERLAVLHEGSPASPWLRMARQAGWPRTIALFLAVCTVLSVVATLLPK